MVGRYGQWDRAVRAWVLEQGTGHVTPFPSTASSEGTSHIVDNN